MTPEQIAAELTAIYRTPNGTMALRPLQGQILLGADISRGVLTNASVGSGKAQPVDEPVLTPAGWRSIGDIRPGDYVIGSDGAPVRVLSVHPQGVRPIMKVTFSDGSWTRCDPQHLWTLRRNKKAPYSDAIWCSPKRTGAQVDVPGSKWETKTLADWLQTPLKRKCGAHQAHNLFAPMVRPIQTPEAALPLDPYTLGALLGDGGMTQVTVNFTTADADILESLQLPTGVLPRETKHQSAGLATQYNLTKTKGRSTRGPNPLREILKQLGLAGCGSATKFIPEMYLRSSVEQRLALLQGLLDTDGTTADPAGGIEYSTLSPHLAGGVIELVQSLGGTATNGTPSANGNARLRVRLPRHLSPFRCKRKGVPYWEGDRQREPYRALTEVRPDGHAECVCISVDAWDSLYVTRNYILTHNTLTLALLLNILGGKRPMIFTESNNLPQMRSEFERYRLHFKIPTYYRLEAYETLGTVRGASLLDDYKPTFVGLDEAHKVKRVQESARARRIDRWRAANPDVPVAALSGSPGAELSEYIHLICWAVPAARSDRGGRIPVSDEGRPEGPNYRRWIKSLDEDDTAREAFWEWLRALPGVVISDYTFTRIPLHIQHTVLPTPPELEEHWERLRRFGEAPDGWPLDEGPGEQWMLARKLSNDMYYEHIPRPPVEWKAPRKIWYRFCREVIEAGDAAPGGPYDTDGQVARAVIGGLLPREAYDAWMRVKDSYQPEVRTTWLGRHALEYAHEWGRRAAAQAKPRSGGGIIWVEPIGVGDELSRLTGWPYYGTGARCTRTRRHVSLADKGGPPVIICSTKSCGTGKNLQHRYSRNLFLVPPSNNDLAEQWLGRTHRDEQSEPEVHAEFLYGCLEDWNAVQKSLAQARVAEQDLTAPRKMLLAQHTWAKYPSKGGFAWTHASNVGPVTVT